MLGPGDVAGPEDDLASPLVDPLVRLPQGRQLEGQIGVGEGNHPAGGPQHGRPHSAAFAAMLGQADRGKPRPQDIGQLPGVIAAAVIRDHDAIVNPPLVRNNPS